MRQEVCATAGLCVVFTPAILVWLVKMGTFKRRRIVNLRLIKRGRAALLRIHSTWALSVMKSRDFRRSENSRSPRSVLGSQVNRVFKVERGTAASPRLGLERTIANPQLRIARLRIHNQVEWEVCCVSTALGRCVFRTAEASTRD